MAAMKEETAKLEAAFRQLGYAGNTPADVDAIRARIVLCHAAIDALKARRAVKVSK